MPSLSKYQLIPSTQKSPELTQQFLGKQMFDRLKSSNPNEVVNVFAATGETQTTEQLLRDSVNATSLFKSLGLKKGDVISIAAENLLNYYVIMLASFYIGVTVNPLNPAYYSGELKHALLISKPKVVFCSETTVHLVEQLKPELEFIKEVIVFGPQTKKFEDTKVFECMLKNFEVNIDSFTPEEIDCSNHNAIILLSSGTTGLPKGVPLTQVNLEESIKCFNNKKYIGIDATDSILLVLPFFHIFGLLVVVCGILYSTKVIILSKFKPNIFLESIQKYQVTKLFLVPPLLLFLTQSPLVQNYDLSSVNYILVGGAPVTKELQKETKKKLQSVALHQVYGATEIGGGCTFQLPDMENLGTVGKLIPNMEGIVWDHNLKQSVGPLEVGELCVRGPMVMKGYLTGTTPIENNINEDGFWHTGDLGYYDEQGYIYLVDRMKELIKYKGFQVPPAELEDLIMTHPCVKECGVIGIPDERCGQLPLAYVVVKDDTTVTKQEIIDYVAERISIQKRLYGGVVFISEIPKTASGKILRRKLLDRYNESLN